MDKFQDAKSQLNPSQRQAVEAIEGPVSVLAGPGTGKTQILTLRVGEILRRTQMNPYNILCLTFTNAGASAMQKRLASAIGTSAYDTNITTFHSFADRIIREFPMFFGKRWQGKKSRYLSFGQLRQIDAYERLRILENLLRAKKWRHIKPIRQNLYYLNIVSDQIRRLKQEKIEPEELRLFAQKKRAGLDPDKRKDALELRKVARTLELASFYQDYRKKLTESGYFDYEDMIDWVVDELAKEGELKSILQERYQYILVDEFQDSNGSQLKILYLLTSFFKAPNLFVVGDPNQSIYRFQGASRANFQDFKKKFPMAQTITLSTNYRSRDKIIKISASLLKNDKNAPKNYNLMSGVKGSGQVQLKLTRFLNTQQEVYYVVERIKNQIKSGVKPSKIAVLVRENRQITPFAQMMLKQSVPFVIEKGESALENPIIKKILALADFLVEPDNKVLFAKALLYLRNQLGLAQVYKIKKIGVESLFAKNKEKSKLRKKTIITIKTMRELAEGIVNAPPAVGLENILKGFGIIRGIAKDPDRLSKLSAIRALLDSAKEYQQQGNFVAWLKKIHLMRERQIEILTPTMLFGENEAVRLQTIHQAKGKEYHSVFLPQLSDNYWNKQKREHFTLPPITADEEDEIAEQRRLFYVALTRAKKNLLLSFSQNADDRELIPSRFLSELSEKLYKKTDFKENRRRARGRIEFGLTPSQGKIHFSKLEQAWMRERLEHLALNPTAFNNYLNCPRDFLFKNIFRAPEVKTASSAYGTAVHFAMENFFSQFKKNGILPKKTILLEGFCQAIEKEVLTKSERVVWRKRGLEVLGALYESQAQFWKIPLRTEYSFRGKTRLGEIALNGKVDKIEWINEKRGEVRVIDYKTGKVRSRNSLEGKTQNSNLDYLYQLKFYQLLSQLDGRLKAQGLKVVQTQIAFIDDDKKFRTETFTFSQKEIDELKSQIKEVWRKINELEFPHRQNKKRRFGCEYCDVFKM